MTPEQILRKKSFAIPLPSDHPGFKPLSQKGIDVLPMNGIKFIERTQDDFLREYNPNSHAIKSLVYYPNSIFKDMSSGKLRAKVHTRISVAYQEMIKTKRKTALIGNNVGMKLITNRGRATAEDMLARYREGWEEFNMEIAIDKCIESDYITGDCAVYVYMTESANKVGWRVFSYQNGDTLYPHFHPQTGEIALLGRKYRQEDEDGNETDFLDVIDDTYFATYKLDFLDGKQSWVVDMPPQRHGFPQCPVAYHRRNDGPVWSASQSLIDNYETGISQFCEYNMVYGLGILFTSGADFGIDTDNDGTPLHIDSPDPNAKATFLDPASEGADGAFAKQLEILNRNIMRCSFAVETPEIKSGADMSSLTVKMLFADSYLKALEDSQEYQLFLDRVASLFKYAYGTVESIDFNEFKVKTYLEPFVFMSETEVINALVQLTAAGVLSKQTATEIAYNSGYGTASEWERILKETQAELVASELANQAKNNSVNASRNQQ